MEISTPGYKDIIFEINAKYCFLTIRLDFSCKTSGPPKFSTWIARIIFNGSYGTFSVPNAAEEGPGLDEIIDGFDPKVIVNGQSEIKFFFSITTLYT